MLGVGLGNAGLSDRLLVKMNKMNFEFTKTEEFND